VTVTAGAETGNVIINLGDPLPGSIAGIVRLPHETRGQAIVEVAGTDFRAIPDSSGTFLLSDIPAGTWTLRAWGMAPYRDTVSLDSVVVVAGQRSGDILLKLKINVLIIDGINNHDWVRTTALARGMLENSGLFSIHVSTTPPAGAPQEEWDGWRPVFSDYDAVFVNYNSGSSGNTTANAWPDEVNASFEVYMQGGGGMVVSQGGQLAFSDWEEYNRMLGLGWRNDSTGFHVFINDSGEVETVPAGTIPHSYARDTALIHTYNGTHPITNGIPDTWLHAAESIDFGLSGPAENMTVLSYTFNPNSGRNEPIDWVVDYGKGRVYNIDLGDIVVTGSDESMRCAGFQTLFICGTEWAATGQVTYPVPDDFPTETEVSLR
jgi:hypothetical protein